MNIVITAGGISEKIDNVRKITNSSSGKLGSIIANQLTKNHKIEKIFYITTKHSIKPNFSQFIEIVEVEGVLDLKKKVKKTLTNNQIDFFIHSMAVSDYMVDWVSTSSFIGDDIRHPREILKGNKISSYEEDLIIKLIPTPKIIKLIKELSPNTQLIGFKLLDGVSEEELIQVAKNLMIKNNCDYVIANDLENIRKNKHIAFIVDKNNQFKKVFSKQEIAMELNKIVNNNPFS